MVQVSDHLHSWHFQAKVFGQVGELTRQAEVCEAVIAVVEGHHIERVRRVAPLAVRRRPQRSQYLRLVALLVVPERDSDVLFMQLLNDLVICGCLAARSNRHDLQG